MIEEAIAKLTAAVEANTAVLNQILATSGTAAPAVEPQPEVTKTTKTKKEKTPDLKVVESESEPEPEPQTEAPAEVEATNYTIKEAVAASMAFLGKDRDANKPKLAALRAKFQVETVKDLAEDQVDAYMAELAKM